MKQTMKVSKVPETEKTPDYGAKCISSEIFLHQQIRFQKSLEQKKMLIIVVGQL